MRGLGLAAVMAALVGWIMLRRRLDRQIDAMVEACHSMALGEPSPLPDAPQGLQDMGRLSLAIQVMHEALLDYLNLYRRFFDAAPDMFLSLAPAGQRILDANTAFCRDPGPAQGRGAGPTGGALCKPWTRDGTGRSARAES